MPENFIKDRDEAFASMDKEKILAYCNKYGIEMPEDELTFWAGVHKAILNLYVLEDSSITLDQFNKSCEWLIAHDFTPEIYKREE